MVKKQKITIKEAVIALAITGVVALPIILYVIINTFDMNQINLLFVTIPRLEVNRYEEITSIFSKDFINNTITNLSNGLKIILLQTDNLPWNAISNYGIIYIFSIIFTIIGIIINLDNKFIIPIAIIYSISFVMFGSEYIKEDFDSYLTFEGNMQEVIEYISQKEDKQIYITNGIKEPYIYVLFYSEYNKMNL